MTLIVTLTLTLEQGGLLDAGESFAEAAVRETFEETGVRTRFRSLLSFWHRHGLTWGKSDLYYVARLEPASATEVEIDGYVRMGG